MQISLIVARNNLNVIGSNNSIPWHVPEDMKLFKEITTGKVVIMGRSTWDSIPNKFKPLPNRINMVLSNSIASIKGGSVHETLEDALDKAENLYPDREIIIIGGESLYNRAMTIPNLVFTVYLSTINNNDIGDKYFKYLFPNTDWLEEERKEFKDFVFQKLTRKGK